MRGALNTTGEPQSAAEAHSCRRKRRFKSLRLAPRESERVFEMFATRTSAYHCRYCGGWHLFSKRSR